MNIRKFTFNPVSVNAFVIWDDTLECVIVDAACFYPHEEKQLHLFIESNHLKPVKLLNTHGHFDHVGCNKQVVAETGAEFLIHEKDLALLMQASRSARNYGLSVEDSPAPARYLTDGLRLDFGRRSIEVLHTPGHTEGGCCLLLRNEKLVVTGDTLFADSVGRTDLPGGSHELLMSSIQDKLMPLDDETVVWPGHGPSTTIGHERRLNPYING